MPQSLPDIIAVVLVAMLAPQVILTGWFAWIVRRRTATFVARNPMRKGAALVPAEVVLCLRGCDPTLDNVFAALARQTHRDWRLRVIVDSVDDPAWQAAQTAVARLTTDGGHSWGAHSIEPLVERPAWGSLKCASLRQALRSLATETRVVALIDADSVVHADWLLTMVDECLQPGIGAVSGNRWYDPDRDSPAAVVRTLWNAGAIVQMTVFDIPWGGSLAVRREALEASDWVAVIASTLCEDTALARPLARSGWAYRFIPALTAIDRDDDVSLGPLTRWIARQLITARLHHPSWPLVAIHGISTSLALAGAVIAGLFFLATSQVRAFATVCGALATYELVNIALAFVIVAAIQRATAAAGKRIKPCSAGRLLRWLALIPLTQGVYAAATLLAICARSVEWRGINYSIRSRHGSSAVSVAPEF